MIYIYGIAFHPFYGQLWSFLYDYSNFFIFKDCFELIYLSHANKYFKEDIRSTGYRSSLMLGLLSFLFFFPNKYHEIVQLQCTEANIYWFQNICAFLQYVQCVAFTKALNGFLQDLDLTKPGIRKSPRRYQFEVTSEEVLRKADFRVSIYLFCVSVIFLMCTEFRIIGLKNKYSLNANVRSRISVGVGLSTLVKS